MEGTFESISKYFWWFRLKQEAAGSKLVMADFLKGRLLVDYWRQKLILVIISVLGST